MAFHIWWDQFASALEGALNDISNQVADIAAAQAAANAAQNSADTAHHIAAVGLGWTSPGSTLTSSDNGTNANIIIANHVRHYGDGTSVNVTGGTITGLYGTKYYVFYDDPTQSGGAVTYQKDTDPNVAADNAASGRHYCGSVTTATAGGGTVSGGGTVPPGGDYSGPGAIP